MKINNEGVNKSKKKVVIDMYFCYSLHTEGINCKYNLFYDSGNGLQNINLDAETQELATAIANQTYEKYSDTFDLHNDSYIAFEKDGKEIASTSNRASLIKNMYDFANDIDIPVFANIEGNVVYLNELKFVSYDKKNESELKSKKCIELDTLIVSEAYGKEYENNKRFKEQLRTLQKIK